MSKEEIAKWQKRIEDTFGGLRGIVGEDHFADLVRHEQKMNRYLRRKFLGYLRIMHAFFDFYIETLREVTSRREGVLPDDTIILTLIHITTLWRFRSSYLCFWKGHFVEAQSLLRAVWENALQIAALRSSVITSRDILGPTSEKTKGLSSQQRDRIIHQHFLDCDKKVHSKIMGNESGLSPKTQLNLRIFVQGLHMSVHKAQTNFVSKYKTWVVDNQPLPIFPTYDEMLAMLYLNPSMFLAWMMTRTLPLLQIKVGEFSSRWGVKYNVLDESFAFAVANTSPPLARSVEELIEKQFEFPEHKTLITKGP